MANAKVRGTDGKLFYAAAAPATTEVTGVTDISPNLSSSTTDCSDHSSGAWGEQMTGTWQWTMDITGWLLADSSTHAADTAQAAIRAAGIAGTVLAWEWRPDGTGSTKLRFYGNGRVSNFKMGSPQNGAAPFSFTVNGVGALTEGTQT